MTYLLLVPRINEYQAFSTEDNLRQYLTHWHLSEDEANIFMDTHIYKHDNMGIMRIEAVNVNPYFDGNKYE
jgi:hypothetical protein